MPGTWNHLALRLVDVVTAPALDQAERATVRGWLNGPDEETAFFAQKPADQRHGYASARYVASEAPERIDLVRAALLHDVGKRHANLGPISRIFASLFIRLGIPLPPRWRLYRDHGALSAAELAGAEEVVVEFARHHHGERPPTIPPDEWDMLVKADSARIGR